MSEEKCGFHGAKFCPFCGGVDLEEVSLIETDDYEFVTIECRICNRNFQVKEEENAKAFYQKSTQRQP